MSQEHSPRDVSRDDQLERFETYLSIVTKAGAIVGAVGAILVFMNREAVRLVAQVAIGLLVFVAIGVLVSVEAQQ